MTLLDIDGLTLDLPGGTRLLDGISLSVAAGETEAAMPQQVRWSKIRASSLMITRIYWQRGGVSTPISFSTARA